MKQNILIVDDQPANLVALEAILEEEGRQLLKATSGNQALSLLLKNDISLVLLDVQMPEMDGYTLTAEIKNNERLKTMPVILHTSLSGVFNNAMVEKVGAEDFIPKFNPDELATAVKKWLKMEE